MTIHQIKYLVEKYDQSNKHFFSKSTLKFFGQDLDMFMVNKLNDNDYLCTCPCWDYTGRQIGYTERIFLVNENKLIYLSEHKNK
jgi:hypothetical protein